MAYINNIEDGIILYDYIDGTEDVQGTMAYSFDSEGNLLIYGNRVEQKVE